MMLEKVILEMTCLPDLTGLFKLRIEEELFKGLPSVRDPPSFHSRSTTGIHIHYHQDGHEHLVSRVHRFFLSLFKSTAHKELVLEFFDKTLFASLGRAKLQVTGSGLMGDSEAMLLWRLLMFLV